MPGLCLCFQRQLWNLGWKGAEQGRKQRWGNKSLVREIRRVKGKEVEPALQRDRRQEKDHLLPPRSGRSGAWEGGQGADPLKKHWPQARLGWLQFSLAQIPLETNLVPHVFYLANNGVRAVGLNPFFFSF